MPFAEINGARLFYKVVGNRGPAIMFLHGADDLEMGALAPFGDLPERAAAASNAGCDLLLVCSRTDLYADAVDAVEREVSEERRMSANRRLDAYGERLAALRASAQPTLIDVARLRDELADLAAACVG
jgi:beta-glucosidase-like glycosyl hydrolase